MKNWTIDEFINECEKLCRNEYDYDYRNMPSGICNGHEVGADTTSWTSVIIDGCSYYLGVIDEKHPEGFVRYQVGSENMNCLEFLRYFLAL